LEYVDASIDNAHLADDAVDSDELAAGAVDLAHLASGVGGVILQVVQAVQTATFTTTANEWTAITGMTVDITPADSNNKIIVTYTINCASEVNQRFGVNLYRDTTGIFYADAAGDRLQSTTIGRSDSNQSTGVHSMTKIDSPATASQVTYLLKGWTEGGGTFYLNRSESDTDNDSYYRGVSSITVMELQV
jgi:hypothetical protein